MTTINIRACDFENNNPMKSILEDLNTREEELVISSIKNNIINGKITRNQACDNLNTFMQLWEGTRKFFLIPDYIESLKNELSQLKIMQVCCDNCL